MTLDELLASLDTPMEKAASTSTSVRAQAVKPVLSAEIESVLTKSASEDLTKQAFAEGEKAAQQLLGQLTMNKQASLAGKDLAQSILEKLAEELAAPTNQIQANTAAMDAQGAAAVQLTPGNGGSVNQILEAIVGDAQAHGATADNLVESNTGAFVERTDPNVEGGGEEDEVEKAAAVQVLVQNGYDFNTAIDLVKQAEFDLAADEDNFQKQAAVNELMADGYDFDSAVQLVSQVQDQWTKQAALGELMAQGASFDEAVELVKEAGEAGKADMFARAGTAIKDAATGAKEATGREYMRLKQNVGNLKRGKYINGDEIGENAKEWHNKGRWAAGKAVAGNRLVQGVAGVTALGGAGYAAKKHYEKTAAFGDLIEQGYDFDTAVELIKEAGVGESIKAGYNTAKGHVSGALDKARAFGARASAATKNEARILKESLKRLATNKNDDGSAALGGRVGTLKYLAKNRIVQGTAAAAALGGAGYAAKKHYEKKAAFEALVDAGYDFDDAVNLVKQAEYEVYGD